MGYARSVSALSSLFRVFSFFFAGAQVEGVCTQLRRGDDLGHGTCGSIRALPPYFVFAYAEVEVVRPMECQETGSDTGVARVGEMEGSRVPHKHNFP